MKPIVGYISEALVGRMSGREISWTEKELKKQVGGEFLKWLGLDPVKHLSKVSVTGDKELHIDLTSPYRAGILKIHPKTPVPGTLSGFKITIKGSVSFPLELILDWNGDVAGKDSEYLNELFKDTYFYQISYGPMISHIEGLNLNASFKYGSQRDLFDILFFPAEGYESCKGSLPLIKNCNINVVFVSGSSRPYIGALRGGSHFTINVDSGYKSKWNANIKEIDIADDDLVLAAMKECASSISPENFGSIMNKDGCARITCYPDSKSKTLESLDKKFPCPWDKASWKDIKNVTIDIIPYSNPRLPNVGIFLSRDNSPAEIRVYMSEADYNAFHREL